MRIDTIIRAAWRQVLGRLVRNLGRRGLSVRPGFDLQQARREQEEGVDILCPHHGTRDCGCQYLVLQVGGREEGPAALIVHGQDTTTRVALRARAASEGRMLAVAALCDTVKQFQASASRARGRRSAGVLIFRRLPV